MLITQFTQKQSPDSREIIDTLLKEVTQHKDHIGLDPWGLRQVKKPNTTIEEVHNILYQDMPLSGDPKEIPKLVHFIWVGSYLTNPAYRRVIAEWAQNNPDYRVILWYQVLVKNDLYAKELNQWACEFKIQLMDIEETLVGNMPTVSTPHGQIRLDEVYANEFLRKQFPQVTDALRLVIVYCFGGIYCDLDHRCLAGLGTIIAEHEILFKCGANTHHFDQKNLSGGDFFNPDHYKLVPSLSYTNQIFAARKHHPYLYEMLGDFCNIYLTPNAILFKNPVGPRRIKYPYDGNSFKSHDGQAINVIRLQYQGSEIFRQLMSRKKIYNLSAKIATGTVTELTQEYKMPNQAIAFYTLIHNYHPGKRPDEVLFPKDWPVETYIKHIVTIVLNDLAREPRVLHLDQFATPINYYNIIDGILELLFTCFKDEVSQLEIVHLTGLLMTKTSMEFLVHEKKLQTNYEAPSYIIKKQVTLNSFLEIDKFMFLIFRLGMGTINRIFNTFFCDIRYYYPHFTEEDLVIISRFIDVDDRVSAQKTQIYSCAYTECYSECVIYPEYAQWLSKQCPILDVNKYSAICSLYSHIKISMGKQSYFQEQLNEQFEQSPYAEPEFRAQLLFERTLDNYVSHLIDLVKQNVLNAGENAKLIDLICRNWQREGLKCINEPLLAILLTRDFKHVTPFDPTRYFECERSLKVLAQTCQVEPLKDYFDKMTAGQSLESQTLNTL